MIRFILGHISTVDWNRKTTRFKTCYFINVETNFACKQIQLVGLRSPILYPQIACVPQSHKVPIFPRSNLGQFHQHIGAKRKFASSQSFTKSVSTSKL